MNAAPGTRAPIGATALALPPPNVGKSTITLVAWALAAGVLVWAWNGAEMRPFDLVRYAQNMATFAADFFPPVFRDWKLYFREMIVTVQIAIWGTVLAIVLAVPFGLLSSSNMAPMWVTFPVRRLMDALRSINEIVFALLFIVAVGLGPFAGVLAIFVHTLGILAKLFSEAVEAIDPRPIEGIRATGASRLEEIVFGVIPQVIPLWISYSLYRFESNVRAATVVGIVGAGGIGFVLWETMRGFQYGETCAILIFILATVTTLDVASSRLRRLFI
ncbi:MAG: phosphonate ABC transporter, permease protein PhnE [Rhodospirillaceae bacterium]|nr:phosphonate ABC transporter, permease protein PhnE [Rhodospirillaceae bacterium]